jgi:hypothetical protein
MAAVRSATESKLPRRMAWRVMIEKNTSKMLSQEPLVGGEVQRHPCVPGKPAWTFGSIARENVLANMTYLGVPEGDPAIHSDWAAGVAVTLGWVRGVLPHSPLGGSRPT